MGFKTEKSVYKLVREDYPSRKGGFCHKIVEVKLTDDVLCDLLDLVWESLGDGHEKLKNKFAKWTEGVKNNEKW